MLHLRFSHCTSASLNASEAHWWVIANAVGLVECLHKSSWLLSCSFVDWLRFPVAFQEALLPICSYMFWWGLCSVGCQERHQDNKSGLRAEWGLSKLCCTRWIGEKLRAWTREKIMSAQLSRPGSVAFTLTEDDLETSVFHCIPRCYSILMKNG